MQVLDDAADDRHRGFAFGRVDAERIETALPLQRLRLGALALHIHQADAQDAPALLPRQGQDLVDVDGLVRPVEITDAEVGDAGLDLGSIIGGLRDGSRQGGEC